MRRRELYDKLEYGYEYVDLDLPSGTLWCTCNIGAHSPEEAGLYFQWGEIQGYTADDVNGFTTSLGKSVPCMKRFAWSDYKWWESGSGSSAFPLVLKKYVSSSYTGDQVNVTSYDDILELEPEDDAASMLMGKVWRMPTQEEYKELYINCTSVWTTLNGVNGRKFTSRRNGKSVFFPAAGLCSNGSMGTVGTGGLYWSSTLSVSNPGGAYRLTFLSNSVAPQSGEFRVCGCNIRGVIRELSPVNSDYIDLGLSVHWAVCNIGAQSETDAGLYFAWGEIQGYTADEVKGFTTSLGKSVPCRKRFDWSDYKWWESGDGTSSTKYVFKKYVPSSYTGTAVDVTSYDDILELELEDDAAYQLMGKGWRMPTTEEFKELYDNCTSIWTTLNGVNCRKFTSNKNGKSVFFPAAGGCYSGSVIYVGYIGYYWSSTLFASNPFNAYYLDFRSGGVYPQNSSLYRRSGCSVRGVLTIKYPKSKDKYQKMEYKVGDFDQ